MKTDRQPPAHFNSRWRFNLRMGQRMLFAGIVGAFFHAKAYADQVDLMVVYTPAVTTIHNGHDGVMAYITSMVSGANQAYTDSGIDQVLHLVHASEINYVEASNRNADLDNLTYSSDGHMDDVHALRDAWGADLVCLLQNSSGGVAWLLSNTNGTPSHGFSVVGTYGAAAGAVLPHELGHNMGGHHDWDNLKGITGLYEDSYGHRFTGEDGVLYRTIMAYPDGQRIFRFSNSALSYAGVPTGIALPEAR
ncbi:MAG: M12 family metallo-peptidase, partial [Opitutales bacterium]|nr:M12 family metallo-peptidase [Opitutales bacterium]